MNMFTFSDEKCVSLFKTLTHESLRVAKTKEIVPDMLRSFIFNHLKQPHISNMSKNNIDDFHTKHY